jgi:hypothetical protein
MIFRLPERCATTGKARFKKLADAASIRSLRPELAAFRCHACGDIHLGHPQSLGDWKKDLFGARSAKISCRSANKRS